MPIPTSIVVIGCGHPSLIPKYRARTGCPFPIYADPSRKLYKALGMSWTLNFGGSRPEYMQDTSLPRWLAGQVKQWGADGRKALKGGNLVQIGGEFLFEDGEVIWLHRMRNYRNHTEIKALRRIMDLDWEVSRCAPCWLSLACACVCVCDGADVRLLQEPKIEEATPVFFYNKLIKVLDQS